MFLSLVITVIFERTEFSKKVEVTCPQSEKCGVHGTPAQLIHSSTAPGHKSWGIVVLRNSDRKYDFIYELPRERNLA